MRSMHFSPSAEARLWELTAQSALSTLPVMATITFDTLKFVHRLRESGMPETQAEAIAEALRDASGDAELATSNDIKLGVAELRKEIRDLKVDLTKWMTGALIAQAAVIATLVKLL